MSRNYHFDQGGSTPPHSFELVDKGEDHGDGRYTMMLHLPGFERAAAVDYDMYEDEYGPKLEISYLKSNLEGQGHARRLMEHVYRTYPKHQIDWGQTIHPASAHLASQFEDKYYNRTAYFLPDEFA